MNGLTPLDVYVIFFNLPESPNRYLCRIQRVFPSGDVQWLPLVYADEPTLIGIRSRLPTGLYRLDRHPEDELYIVETWI